jgi:hypothetical protein
MLAPILMRLADDRGRHSVVAMFVQFVACVAIYPTTDHPPPSDTIFALDVAIPSSDLVGVAPIVISEEEKARIMEKAHLLGHYGGNSLYKTILKDGINWVGLFSD